MAADDVPRPAGERDRFLRLMEREAVLGACAWAIDIEGARREDAGGLLRALPDLDAPAVVLGTGEDAAPAVAVRVALRRLPIPERVEVLTAALRRHVAPRTGLPPEAAAAAAMFDLGVPDVELAAQDVARGHALWTACRARARSRFGALAQVAPAARRLGRPGAARGAARAAARARRQVRHRATVLDDWGFARALTRGLGHRGAVRRARAAPARRWPPR